MQAHKHAIRPIDTLTRKELGALIERPSGPSVSLFLPIERAEPARQQHPIRLASLLRQAQQRLLARGLDAEAAHDLLAPIAELLSDRSFWDHLDGGLAAFVGADLLRVYRLPQDFEELAIVDTSAYVAPLLPLLSGDGTFYLLTLGLGGVRLLHGTRYGLSPIALHDVPTSLQNSLIYDEFARETQLHQGVPGRGGERGAIFHGQGALDGTAVKEEAQRYFNDVERGVRRALSGAQAPLLLAGVAYLLPLYRAVNSYAHVLDENLPVNTDDLQTDELHARTWEIVARSFDQERAAATERYRQLRGGEPRLATDYLRTIIPAAYQGRIDTLFLAAGQRRWGSFDPASGALEVHDEARAQDSELYNQAAIQAIKLGGVIYVVAPQQMPEAAPLAAILRY